SSPRTVALEGGGVTALDISAEGIWLAAGCEDGSVYLIPATADNPPRLLCREAGPISCVGFHPKQPLLAMGMPQQTIRCRDLITGVEMYTHEFGIDPASLAFSADGSSVAVADGDSLGFWTSAATPEGMPQRHDHLHLGSVRQIRAPERIRQDRGTFWLTASGD